MGDCLASLKKNYEHVIMIGLHISFTKTRFLNFIGHTYIQAFGTTLPKPNGTPTLSNYSEIMNCHDVGPCDVVHTKTKLLNIGRHPYYHHNKGQRWHAHGPFYHQLYIPLTTMKHIDLVALKHLTTSSC